MLPECFLSIYPTRLWAGGMVGDREAATRSGGGSGRARSRWPARTSTGWSRRAASTTIRAVGVNEREPDRPGGTLYNTCCCSGRKASCTTTAS